MSRRFVIALCCLLISASSGVLAQDVPPSKLRVETKKAVIFKDGYCLIVKKATGTTDESGVVYTDDVPDAAVLGTFWAVPTEGELRSMVSGWVKSTETTTTNVDCERTIDLVTANIGSECSLKVGHETTLRGTILSVLRAKASEPPATSQGEFFSEVSPPGHSFLLRTPTGDVLVDANNVRLLTIRDMKTKVDRRVAKTKKTKRLTFRFSKRSQPVEMLIMYFRPGVRWIPTYRFDLSQPALAADGQSDWNKQVRLTLQGEIINEAEELRNVPLDVVVGVPNFRFRDVPSPIVLESVLRNTLVQAAPQLMNQAIAQNRMMSNYAMSVHPPSTNRGETDASAIVNLPDELTTKSGNDLFVYSLPALTLRKGDRATVPILSAVIPYRDVYTWDVTVKHSESISVAGRNASPLTLTDNTVWRQIELQNTSDIPWTAGAAMIVDGFQPLAQEILTYTPAGARCRIPVTVAVDVQGRIRDRETGREINALRFAGSSYAEVRGRIVADVVNNKTAGVDIEVRLRFGGTADEISDEGQELATHFRSDDWENYRGDPAVNNSSTATWSTTVEPGANFAPSVNYHFYTRH